MENEEVGSFTVPVALPDICGPVQLQNGLREGVTAKPGNAGGGVSLHNRWQRLEVLVNMDKAALSLYNSLSLSIDSK